MRITKIKRTIPGILCITLYLIAVIVWTYVFAQGCLQHVICTLDLSNDLTTSLCIALFLFVYCSIMLRTSLLLLQLTNKGITFRVVPLCKLRLLCANVMWQHAIKRLAQTNVYSTGISFDDAVNASKRYYFGDLLNCAHKYHPHITKEEINETH